MSTTHGDLADPQLDGIPPEKGKHDSYAAFRYRDFRLFALASMIDTIGGEMVAVAVGWDLYEKTGSEFALGLVGLVLAIPVVALSLPAGQVADRFSRRGIVLATQVVWMVTSIGLVLIDRLRGPVWMIYACVGVAGVANAFAFPARWAIVPLLVPPKDFNNAVTWRSSAWQVAAVIGPGLGGILIAMGNGAISAYLADVGLGMAAFALVAAMRITQRAKPTEPVSWSSLIAGWKFVARTELILATITLDMFAVLLGGATTLLPVFAKSILQVGPAGLGWLRAAPSLGAFLMAITLAHRPPMKRAGRALILAVIGFGAATIVFGLSKNFWLSVAMLFLAGAFDNISVVVRSTLVQVLTPDSLRGRVSAVNSIFIGLSNELGGFESGLAARLIGTVPSVVFGGIGSIAVVLGIVSRWPGVARLGSLTDAKPETTGGETVAT